MGAACLTKTDLHSAQSGRGRLGFTPGAQPAEGPLRT